MPIDKSIIAIDGPAGAGKSTVAKLVAKKLGFLYIDTGALYRALTLKVKRKKIDIKNERAIIDLLKQSSLDLEYYQGNLKVLLDEEDVSEEIRKPYITDGVSEVSKIKEVRKIITDIQRRLARDDNSVLEGRDIGTVVFPNAKHKFFLDAHFDERVKRRFKELQDKNKGLLIESIQKDLATRDKIDSTREIAPLKKAKDAIYIDTTDLSINEVVDKIISQCRKV
jgi:cytidylate kinase